jgi:hypothetical protein
MRLIDERGARSATRAESRLGGVGGRSLLTAIAASLILAACSPAPPPTPAAPPAPIATPDAGRDPDADLEDRIRAVIVKERPQLRACYEATLAKDPTHAGRVVLVVEVDRDGIARHVFEGRREGLLDEEVRCFVRVLKSIKFHDGAARAMKVQLPLSFTPEAETSPASTASPGSDPTRPGGR